MEATSGRSRALKWMTRILVSGLVTFLTLEVFLRLFSAAIPRFIGNEVFSPYRHDASGIFFKDAVTTQRFMRPLRDQTVLFNNYAWKHHTDRWGFRNPPGCAKEILLMGDSMIYGQGVDEEDTVTHILREERRLPVYNMSRTGDSLLQQYVLLRTYLEEFNPKKVVLLVFINDFDDLDGYRQEQLDYPTVRDYDYAALLERLKNFEPVAPLRVSYALRFLRYLPKHLKPARENAPPANQEAAPSEENQTREESGLSEFSKQTFRDLLKDLQERCLAGEVELEIVFLHLGDQQNQFTELQEPIDKFLTELSTQLDISYSTTKGLFTEEDFLSTDGHFSPRGHRLLANFLQAEVLQK